MVVNTLIRICNERGEEIRAPFKTSKFSATSDIKIIEEYILKKCGNATCPIDLRIYDPNAGFVTLDQDYLVEYDPFNSQISSNSPSTIIKIEVRLPSKIVEKKRSAFPVTRVFFTV